CLLQGHILVYRLFYYQRVYCRLLNPYFYPSYAKYLFIFSRTSENSNGFVIYSSAPVSSPIILSSSWLLAVIIIIGIFLYLLSNFKSLQILYPLIFGIITSKITRSGFEFLAKLNPSSPSYAQIHSN